jgi:hypothetical protein
VQAFMVQERESDGLHNVVRIAYPEMRQNWNGKPTPATKINQPLSARAHISRSGKAFSRS